jgi:glycosyltransferase involved in cell wall biosynthesis
MIKRAGIVTLTDPFESRHGGTVRTRAFIQLLQQQAIETTVLTPRSTIGSQFVGEPNHQNFSITARVKHVIGNVKRHYLPMPTVAGAKDTSLSEAVACAPIDLILISVLSQAPYADLTGAVLWLDFMDVWSDFALREADRRRGLARFSARRQARILRRLEETYSHKASVVTVAGWTDFLSLKQRGINAIWLPSVLPDNEFGRTERRQMTTKQRTVGFLGNFDYWPNRDAYAMLVDSWLPLLREHGWHVLVAGLQSSEVLEPVEGIEIMGEVADLEQFYCRVDITLAPIRLGGGMKVKVLESLAHGVPVVGTRFAFEGFPASLQGFLQEVSDVDPDFSRIDRLEAPDPASPALDKFRLSRAVDTVHSIIESIGERHG